MCRLRSKDKKTEMTSSKLEARFSAFLDEEWELSDWPTFSLAHIRLLRIFEQELPENVLTALGEREKQLRGEKFLDCGFEQLKQSMRSRIGEESGADDASKRRAALNRLIFAAFLDTPEEDFFYLTEPMFEFAQNTGVSSKQLSHILEVEFQGLRL